MKKKDWILAPIIALLVGAICFFAGSLKEISYGAVYGNGIDIEGGAKFTLSSGTIKSSRKVDYGGGVSVTNGTFIMSGGTIEGNSATYGGGVYVGSSGTFTMSGGTIKSNTATYGGAIYISSGTFNYGGGTITGEIYTNTTININKKPSSALTINYSGITTGTKIAKIASGVTASASDYSVTNLPSGMKLEVQNISGTNYLVAIASGFIKISVTGPGSVNRSAYDITNPESRICYIDVKNENLTFTLKFEDEPFYSEGSVSTITATPDSTGFFDGWFIDGARIQNGRIYVKGKMEIEAKFGALDSAFRITAGCSLQSSSYGNISDIVDFEVTSGKVEQSMSTSNLTCSWYIPNDITLTSTQYPATDLGLHIGDDIMIKCKVKKFGYYVDGLWGFGVSDLSYLQHYGYYYMDGTVKAIPAPTSSNKVIIGIPAGGRQPNKDELIAAFQFYCSNVARIGIPKCCLDIDYYKDVTESQLMNYVTIKTYSNYVQQSTQIRQETDFFIADEFTIPTRKYSDNVANEELLTKYDTYLQDANLKKGTQFLLASGSPIYGQYAGNYYNSDTSRFNEYFVVWNKITPPERRKTLMQAPLLGYYVGSSNCPVDFDVLYDSLQEIVGRDLRYYDCQALGGIEDLCYAMQYYDIEGYYIVDGSVFSKTTPQNQYDREVFDYNALFSFIGLYDNSIDNYNQTGDSYQIESFIYRLFNGVPDASMATQVAYALQEASTKGNWLDMSGNLGGAYFQAPGGGPHSTIFGLGSDMLTTYNNTTLGFYQTEGTPWHSVSPLTWFEKYGIKYSVWNGNPSLWNGNPSINLMTPSNEEESDESKERENIELEKSNITYYDNKKFILTPIRVAKGLPV